MLPRDPNFNPDTANQDIKLAGLQYERDADAAFGDHIMNTVAVCNSSATHTYGNVIAIIEKWLLDDIFRTETFHTVTAATTLTSRQIKHIPGQLHKNEMPMMVLIPRISFGQEDNRFLAHTIMNERMTNTHALWGDGSLLPLAADPRKRLYVHGHYNRAVMYIDVVVAFDTFTEQMNAMSSLHNMCGVGHPEFITAPLELYIPEEFCKLISHISQVPIEDKDVSKFLTYMNTVWNHPITYKLKGGSNSNEFFMYYVADIDTLVSDINPGTGIKEGQIKRGFDISFTVRCDFNTIGYFTLNHPDIKHQIDLPSNDGETIVPIFSDTIDLNDFTLPVGWVILSWPIFKLNYGENSISIDTVLNDSLRTVIDYHLKMHIPIDRFLKIEFRENGEILTNEAYYIDWAQRRLVLTNPNHRRTYRLIITTSPEYVNELVKSLYDLE